MRPIFAGGEGSPRDCCDGPGGKETLRNQVCMPLDGRVHCIDHCIHHIVAALNAGGIPTVASCCGHGTMPGRIDLEDGRVLILPRHRDLVANEGIITLTVPHGGSDDRIHPQPVLQAGKQ